MHIFSSQEYKPAAPGGARITYLKVTTLERFCSALRGWHLDPSLVWHLDPSLVWLLYAVISRALSFGGVWINVGPLQYHQPSAGLLRLAYDELVSDKAAKLQS